MSRHTWIVIWVVIVWWTLEGLVTTGQLLTMQWSSDEVLTFAAALRRGLFTAWLWVPLSLGLFSLVAYYPFERGRLFRSIGLMSVAVAGVVWMRAVSIWGLNPWLGWYREPPSFGDVLITSIWNNFMMAWLNIGVAHGWLFAQRAEQRKQQAQQLQVRLTETRLEALRAQINPHFLFNALNSIAEMVHREPVAADRMLVGLGELLRSSLDHRRYHEVPLHEELRLLRHYLDIEKVRLGDRLRLHWDIGEGLDDALLPPLVLQLLAENAIRHAIAERIRPGHLYVCVCGSDGWLAIEVRDDGDGRPARRGWGVGLDNIRARLQCLYGDAHSLRLEPHPEGGMRASIRLPLRYALGAD